jgi:hypothetical protein
MQDDLMLRLQSLPTTYPITTAVEKLAHARGYRGTGRDLHASRNRRLLTSPRTAAQSGEYSIVSGMISFKVFVTSFAGHIVGEAAWLG